MHRRRDQVRYGAAWFCLDLVSEWQAKKTQLSELQERQIHARSVQSSRAWADDAGKISHSQAMWLAILEDHSLRYRRANSGRPLSPPVSRLFRRATVIRGGSLAGSRKQDGERAHLEALVSGRAGEVGGVRREEAVSQRLQHRLDILGLHPRRQPLGPA